MIKDEERAAQIFEEFPSITAELVDEIERECLPQYLFFRKRSRNETECFCTHCRESFVNSSQNRIFVTEFKHNSPARCPHCGRIVKLKAMHYGRKTLIAKNEVCAFQAKGDNLYCRHLKLEQRFDGDELVPDVYYTEISRFYLAPNEIQKWKYQYVFDVNNGKWRREFATLKSEKAPSWVYVYAGLDCIKDTFLRYFDIDSAEEKTNINLMQYMITAAKHPNLEYLAKKNMWSLIAEILNTNMSLINWRSNNLKTMLGLNKNELDAVEWNVERLKFHHKWAAREPRSVPLIMQIICGARSYDLYRYNCISDLAPTLSLAKMYKYSGGSAQTLLHWSDYLRMAANEGYDMTDNSVIMPPNLNAAHDRLVNTSKCVHDRNMDKLIEKRNKKLQRLIFSDENYSVVLPKSVQDIVNEGQILHHCVGGYAERHAKGILTILFIRQNNDLETRYYTMEVATDYHIVQCRGYRNNLANNPKPEEMTAFEKKYAAYLQQIKCENTRKASA